MSASNPSSHLPLLTQQQLLTLLDKSERQLMESKRLIHELRLQIMRKELRNLNTTGQTERLNELIETHDQHEKFSKMIIEQLKR